MSLLSLTLTIIYNDKIIKPSSELWPLIYIPLSKITTVEKNDINDSKDISK